MLSREDDKTWNIAETRMWQSDEINKLKVYTCYNCGGRLLAGDAASASACPYCSNPMKISDSFEGGLKPNLIIPFKLNKDDAIKQYMRNLRGKNFVPGIFKNDSHIYKMRGVYAPVWLYSANANVTVSYDCANNKFQKDEDEGLLYRESSEFKVDRKGSVTLKDIPVNASKRVSDDLIKSLEPYDYEDLRDFDMSYLSSYFISSLDLDPNRADRISKAYTRMKNSANAAFQKDLKEKYDNVSENSIDISLSNKTCSYALFPVWLLSTEWNEEIYTFAMNGVSGENVGEIPMDMKMLWLRFAILAVALTTLFITISVVVMEIMKG